jgi:hypothetical protein
VRWVLAALCLVGCGRLGFTPAETSDASMTATDASDDDVDAQGVPATFYVVVDDPGNLETDDVAIGNHLQASGRDWGFLADTEPPPAANNSVVVILDSAATASLSPTYATHPRPIIVLERAYLDEMFMTDATGNGTLSGLTDITILDIDHPLRGGIEPGTYPLVGSPNEIGEGDPLPGADLIAMVDVEEVLFVYEPGTLLADGNPAPSCRIAFPGGNGAPTLYTQVAWDLFDAAIAYADACR